MYLDNPQENKVEINIDIARKVLETVDAGLVSGLGNPAPGRMCVEAAVCYAMGLPHGDNPSCVAPALRRLKVRLNDSRWSSAIARSRGMRRLALAQLGSAGALDEKEFARRVVLLAIKSSVPQALRAAASVCKTFHKDKLLTLADLCERDPTEKNARDAAYAATNAAADAAYAAYTATNAAANAAYAATNAAADAAYAAYAAAYAAAATNAAAYAAYAAYTATYAAIVSIDKLLSTFAEEVVKILIDMKAPGCQWLVLTE
jgi:hypothetical protein